MKLITKTLLILYLLLIPAQSETNKLVVYTYDSFVAEWGPGPALEAKFEEFCMCDLQFVGLSDGVEILTRVMYEGPNTNADIVLGLDSNLTHKAKMTGMFDNHSLDLQNLNISDRFEDEVFVPYDFGYFSFIYNSSEIQNPPTSFDELLNSKISIIIQDPRTSTPGLGLLLWIKKVYGDEASEVWEKLNSNILTVTPGWSEAYGLFLDGEADMVLSYTTSPAYHITYEDDDTYKAAKFTDGHYEQIEVAAKLANNENDELADKFLSFLISKDAQDIIPETQWMYPVIDDVKLSSAFEQLINIEKPLRIEAKEVDINNEKWIREWEASLSK